MMMTINKPIIVLTGPTASGKTAISMGLAERFNCEIICADSTTVYCGMDVGTAKPTSEEMQGIPHHLLNIVNPDEEFNASIFMATVTKIVDEIHARGHVPMLVGGSVLYIDAFVFNYNLPPVEPDEELREELEKIDTFELFEKLCKLDPECEWTIDRHNRRRIIRAIEVWMKTERPFSEHKSKTPLPENILYLAVEADRDKLYEHIDERVDQMFRDGLIEEVKGLYAKYGDTPALKAGSYRQVIDFLQGNDSIEEAATKTKQNHRNNAKKQFTWLRRNKDIHWVKNSAEAEKLISKFLL